MLSLASASLGLHMRAPAARPAASITMMAKSESLPFMEAPAHLDGMIGKFHGCEPRR